MNQNALLFTQKITKYKTIGASGVDALPLAAGRNEGGHYFHYKNITALFREYNRALLFLGCRRVPKSCMGY